MHLCKSILLARQEAGTTEDPEHALELENLLFWELIRLYRQPDKLYRYTTKVSPESDEGGPLLASYKNRK